MTRFKDDFYHKWLYKNISTMHAVTYQVKAQIEKFIPSDICPKVEMVYMGTSRIENDNLKIKNLKAKYNLTDEFIVGIVGRIEEGKGQYLVIEAIEKLRDLNQNLNIKAIIVGATMDDNYLKNLKFKIKNLKLDDKIIFTGFTKEVNEHMQLFDVNILATPKETFGLVVIEAMINNVCMCATNAGGPLEIIDDGKDGLLFDRTSEDLASKIQSLYADVEYINKRFNANFRLMPTSKKVFFKKFNVKDDVVKKVLSSWAKKNLKEDSDFVLEVKSILSLKEAYHE